jgi:hypothetical protein
MAADAIAVRKINVSVESKRWRINSSKVLQGEATLKNRKGGNRDEKVFKEIGDRVIDFSGDSAVCRITLFCDRTGHEFRRSGNFCTGGPPAR